MKRENAGSWNSGLEREQILETYFAQLQNSWNSMKVIFGINKKILSEENTKGGPPTVHDRGGRTPCLVGHLAGLWCPSSAIWSLSMGTKIRSHLLGHKSAATRWNLGRTNLGLWQSFSAGETSLPEGEITAIVITNAPLIRRGQSPSTSSSAPSHLKTQVHLLYPILYQNHKLVPVGC